MHKDPVILPLNKQLLPRITSKKSLWTGRAIFKETRLNANNIQSDKLTWWTSGSRVFSTECVRISKVLGSHFILCFSTWMSPLTAVVPRLMVPEISSQMRTAQESTADAMEIFLSKLQTEISIILITWLAGPASGFSGMQRLISSPPISEYYINSFNSEQCQIKRLVFCVLKNK